MDGLFCLCLVVLFRPETVLAGDKGAKLFTPVKQSKDEDKTVITDCVVRCALSDTCESVTLAFSTQTCNFHDYVDTIKVNHAADIVYRKTYPPPPTCENGGFWGDTSKTYCNCPGNFTGTYCQRYIRDCSEGYSSGKVKSGVYTIQPAHASVPFQVYCGMKWGGRTYIQRQKKGINYYRSWQEYRDGFGSASGDYWLGLQKIKDICDSRVCRLMINIKYTKCCPPWKQAFFHLFNLTGEDDGYRMTFTNMTGTPNKNNSLPDALTELKGARFSTYDRDNDDNPKGNCAQTHRSGWWFKNCASCNPNGRLKPVSANVTTDPTGVYWLGDTYGTKDLFMSLRTYE